MKKKKGASHLPRIGARAATPCNCPIPTAFPVPPGIQFFINNTTNITSSFNSHSTSILKPITRNFL